MSWRRRARRRGRGSRHEKDRLPAVFLCVFLPAGGRMGASPPRRRAGVAPAGAGWGVSCPGGEQVLRLRARDGAFRAPARVPFFFCKKKGTKENHSNLRFKVPLARGGFRRCGGESIFPWRGGGLRRPHFFLRRKKCGKESRLDLRSKDPWRGAGKCKFGGAGFAELVRRGSLSVRGIACTSCAAAADSSDGRGWCAGRVAIIKSRLCRRKAAKVGVPVGHRI